MGRAAPYLIRLSAAFLAVVGQLAFAGSSHFCDMPCCATRGAASCCQTPTPAPDLGEAHCPLCHEAEERPEQRVPCRCQLDTRHEDAATTPARASIDLRAIDQVVVATLHDVTIRPTPEFCRRIIDESREIPYRPPRIVLGVWLN